MRLFISYAHNDKKIVEQLADDLKKLGHDGWFDEDLTGSEKWWQRILDEIEACEVFVYAVSPDAIDSPACRTEYQYASDLNKPTLPVMLRDAELIGGLREIQFVDARKLNSRDTALALGRSLGHIQREILQGTHNAPAEAPPRPQFPFPEDPLTGYRERIHHLRDVPETELLMMVYELKQLGRSGVRTAREVRDLLQQMYRSPHIPRGVMSEIQDALNALPDSRRPNRTFQLLGLLILAVIVAGGAYFAFLRDDEEGTPATEVAGASDTPTLTINELTATVVLRVATETQQAIFNQMTATQIIAQATQTIAAVQTNEARTPTDTPTLDPDQMTATVIIAGATQTQHVLQTLAAITPTPIPTEPVTEVALADMAYDDEIFFCEAIITNADPADGQGRILARANPGAESAPWDTFLEDQRIQVLAQDSDETGAIWYLAGRFFNELVDVFGWIRGDVVFISDNCQPPRLSEDIFEQLVPPLEFACPLTIFDQPEANVYDNANDEIFILKIPLEGQAEAVARVPGQNNRFWYNVRARLDNAVVQGWLPSTAVQVAEGCEIPVLLEE